jgi:predicted nucleic acid-binding protein
LTALFCYMDSSALVKRYLTEPGSIQIRQLIDEADAVGTASISRAEVVATFGKVLRLGGWNAMRPKLPAEY